MGHLLQEKDVNTLLEAGFSEADLGLIPGAVQGVELYETISDYFLSEYMENLAEEGCINFWDESAVPIYQESMDRSRPELWDDQPYYGFEDPLDEIPAYLHKQIDFIQNIKIGRMSFWQARTGDWFKWPVKTLNVTIPEDERVRLNNLDDESRKLLFKSYARQEWKTAWMMVCESLKYILIDSLINKNGTDILVLSGDAVRTVYEGLPEEVKWVTVVYFEKDNYWR